jgi:hypothetical protein
VRSEPAQPEFSSCRANRPLPHSQQRVQHPPARFCRRALGSNRQMHSPGLPGWLGTARVERSVEEPGRPCQGGSESHQRAGRPGELLSIHQIRHTFPGTQPAGKRSAATFATDCQTAAPSQNPPRHAIPDGPVIPRSAQRLGEALRRNRAQTEMLTPKGEHSFPCSTRVMFDGRISFDGIATAKTL